MVKEQEQNQIDISSPRQSDENINTKLTKRENRTIVSENSFNALNLFDAKQLAAAESFLTKIIRSKKGGIDNINDGLAILMRAQDLNLPFSSCLEHIHVINDKTGVDIHIVKSLLLRAGCTWRCLNDYKPLYEYTDGFSVYIDNSFPDYVVKCKNLKESIDKSAENKDNDLVYVYPVRWYQDFNNNLYKDYQLNSKQFAIVSNKLQVNEVIKNGKIPVYRIPNKPVDYITTYEFTRTINGKEITAISHFSYSDAIQADMFKKETYQKYPRILIGHRAFTLGARDIASDLLLGVMETTELKILTGNELSSKDIVSVEDAEIIDI